MLKIENLFVSMDNRELLSGISLDIPAGARHLLRGANGSGKSTLAQVIAGNPKYKINSGKIIFNDVDITNETTTNRALRGIFLGAQNVPEIPGLSVMSFLKYSCIAHKHFQTCKDLSMGEFLGKLQSACDKLSIPKDWLNRSVNVGFSGGERKRLMLLQLLLTRPLFAILDEPDSGADAATQQQIVEVVAGMPDTTFLIVSHQKNFTDIIKPTRTTTLSKGKISAEEILNTEEQS